MPPLPIQVGLFLSMLLLLAGYIPHHDMKCLSDSNTDISVPISAIRYEADKLVNPGIVVMLQNCFSYGHKAY